MIGFAFNNRLLFGGFAGESNALPGGLNPLNDPAQENLTLLLARRAPDAGFRVGRAAEDPGFHRAFRQAFPEEAQDYAACKVAAPNEGCQEELDKLVNDDTVLRATATFLRTAVTRNTPFDRFLAGADVADRAANGAARKLFFTKAEQGGAGCFSCHSGPMLNKQPNDPDVAGIGQFVEQNFFNIGIGDHPRSGAERPAAGTSAGLTAEGTHSRTERTPGGEKSRTIRSRRLQVSQPHAASAEGRTDLLPQRVVHQHQGRRELLQRRHPAGPTVRWQAQDAGAAVHQPRGNKAPRGLGPQRRPDRRRRRFPGERPLRSRVRGGLPAQRGRPELFEEPPGTRGCSARRTDNCSAVAQWTTTTRSRAATKVSSSSM